MELIAINLARIIAFVEILSFDPKGAATAPESSKNLAERYSFTKVPQTPEEMDFQKGAHYLAGRFEEIAIDQITLYHNGLVIDTRSSTDNSERILQDILALARERSGVSIAPTKKYPLSQIIFRSDLKLALLNPILQPIADRLSSRTSSYLNHPVLFEPTAVLLGPDVSQIKNAPSVFSIERRTDAAFKENTYFSSAPLPTSEHLKLIEEVESSLR
jgi:hypothetical protein